VPQPVRQQLLQPVRDHRACGPAAQHHQLSHGQLLTRLPVPPTVWSPGFPP
jgi:hypothetical protein